MLKYNATQLQILMDRKYMYRSIAEKKITVTGGAGFIGSNLTDFLLDCGCKVVVLDNFATGRRENLLSASQNPDFQLIEGDIRDVECCRAAVAGADMVVHLAALGSVPRSIKDPVTSVAVNVAGFVNVFFAAVSAGVKRCVYASSSSVYGDAAGLPKVENLTGTALSPYALTKAADELFAENFRRVYGLDSIGLRFFNVFGPRQDPAGAYAAVIPKFAAALLAHESPVINGDGSFSRDFTYVANAVQAICRALVTGDPDAVNQVYNVACGTQVTLNELFSALRIELAEFDPEISGIAPRYAPVRPGDIPHSLADISKAQRLLGYCPEVPVSDGIALSARWYAAGHR